MIEIFSTLVYSPLSFLLIVSLIVIIPVIAGYKEVMKYFGIVSGFALLFDSLLITLYPVLKDSYIQTFAQELFPYLLSLFIVSISVATREHVFENRINDIGVVFKAQALSLIVLWGLIRLSVVDSLTLSQLDQLVFLAIISYIIGNALVMVSGFSLSEDFKGFVMGLFIASLLGVVIGHALEALSLTSSVWWKYQLFLNRFFVITSILAIFGFLLPFIPMNPRSRVSVFGDLRIDKMFIPASSLDIAIGKHILAKIPQGTYILLLKRCMGGGKGLAFLGEIQLTIRIKYKVFDFKTKSLLLFSYLTKDLQHRLIPLGIYEVSRSEMELYGITEREIKSVLEQLITYANEKLCEEYSVIKLPFTEIVKGSYFRIIRVGPLSIMKSPILKLIKLGPIQIIKDASGKRTDEIYGIFIADNKICMFHAFGEFLRVDLQDFFFEQSPSSFRLIKGNLEVFIDTRAPLKELRVEDLRVRITENKASLEVNSKKIIVDKTGNIRAVILNNTFEKFDKKLANQIINRLENLIDKALSKITKVDEVLSDIKHILNFGK